MNVPKLKCVGLLVVAAAILVVFMGCDEVQTPKVYARNIVCKTDHVTLMFGGDVMMARRVGEFIETQKNGDYTYLFKEIKPVLSTADLVFVNLESVISDTGDELVTKVGPKFRADPKSLDGLIDAGIGMVSIANNHCFDYQKTAYEDSINRLRTGGLLDIGGGFNSTEALTPVVCTFVSPGNQELVKVAFIGFNGVGDTFFAARANATGTALLTKQNLSSGIKAAKASADLVVVSMHYGTELGETPDADQTEFAQYAVDQGADLVVGHHPHVVQPVTTYSGKTIAYSMGNMVFDQYNEQTRKGEILVVTVDGKTISSVRTEPFTISVEYQPIPDQK